MILRPHRSTRTDTLIPYSPLFRSPSRFPTTSLAGRGAIGPAEGWTLRAALLDGVPGDPDHPARTAIRLGHGDGALAIGEVEAPLGQGKLLLGHWRYTAQFDRNDGSGSAKGKIGRAHV